VGSDYRSGAATQKYHPFKEKYPRVKLSAGACAKRLVMPIGQRIALVGGTKGIP
jgi:hypothetical protein